MNPTIRCVYACVQGIYSFGLTWVLGITNGAKL